MQRKGIIAYVDSYWVIKAALRAKLELPEGAQYG